MEEDEDEYGFCTALLIEMGIVDYANSEDDNVPVYPLNVNNMNGILDRIKKRVKDDKYMVNNQINNHLYETFIGQLDLDYNYAYDLKDCEKVKFMFGMVMEAYMKNAYGPFIFNI